MTADPAAAMELAKLLPTKRCDTDDFEGYASALEASNKAIEERDKLELSKKLIAATPRLWATWLILGLNLLAVFINYGAYGRSHVQFNCVYGPGETQLHLWRIFLGCFISMDSNFPFWFPLLIMVFTGILFRQFERLFGGGFAIAIYLLGGVTGLLISIWRYPFEAPSGYMACFAAIGTVGYGLRYWGSVPWKFSIGNSYLYLLLMCINGPQISPNFCYYLAGGCLSGIIFSYLASRPLEPEKRSKLTLQNSVMIGCLACMLIGLIYWRLEVLAPERKAKAIRAGATLRQAEDGDKESQVQMGNLFVDGDGVPKSRVEAYKWWQLANDQSRCNSLLLTEKETQRADILLKEYLSNRSHP